MSATRDSWSDQCKEPTDLRDPISILSSFIINDFNRSSQVKTLYIWTRESTARTDSQSVEVGEWLLPSGRAPALD